MDIVDIQRMILEYYGRIYTTKFNNLKEMNMFIEIYNFLKMNHEELENLNGLNISEDTETTIKHLSKNKRPGADDFTSEFNQTFKDLILFIPKLLQKN